MTWKDREKYAASPIFTDIKCTLHVHAGLNGVHNREQWTNTAEKLTQNERLAKK